MASAVFEDLGDRRRVSVTGCQVDASGRVSACTRTRDSPLSIQTLHALTEGQEPTWLIHHIERFENPSSLGIRVLADAFLADKSGLTCLDFGCGYGASSLELARLGHKVHGVDLAERTAEIARMVAADYGYAEAITYTSADDTTNLPYDEQSFDVVCACGVLEHVSLRDRRAALQECWRLLRPGGVLLICDSPNLLWPIDNHTSWLPFVHWLPLRIAGPLIRRFSRRAARNYDNDGLLAAGLRGVNLLGILRALPGGRLLRAQGGSAALYFCRYRGLSKGGRVWRLAALLLYGVFRVAEPIGRLIRLPVEAFFPSILVAIQKGYKYNTGA